MDIRRRAKITVDLDRLGYEKSEYFIGTEDEVIAEAGDWMHMVALQFIEENAIEDEWEQDLIIGAASFSIQYLEEGPIMMYALIETDCCDQAPYGVYASKADAEEALFTEAESWAYQVMMTEDPADVFGGSEWSWKIDYKWLMEDCISTFRICEVPVFGVKEVIV